MALAGCAGPGGLARPEQAMALAPVPGSPAAAVESFVAVLDRVTPTAEAICHDRTRGVPCAYRVAVDDRGDQPPNAFQSLDDAGRPVLVFNVALLESVRNADELAFVVGHEAAHHILDHIARQRRDIMEAALAAGALATLNGADPAAVRRAQDIGAEIGARRFSKEFELEADALGTEIAWRAGYDPVKGALFFTRLPDPGNRFLGTHPPNAQRLAVVRDAMATLR